VSSAHGADGEPEHLSLDQARHYMVTLINRDRAAHGLQPVVLDAVASQAGQVHTADMVLNNHSGHYDVDGKKPWQRYSEAGGCGYVSENAFWSWFSEQDDVQAEEGAVAKPFALLAVQTFNKSAIDEAESSYYNEVPPNDGHRVNILNQIHTGVGIALTMGSDGGRMRFANTQEFTDNYGLYTNLPGDLSKPFYVGGLLADGWAVQCISILWEPAPQAITPEVIEKMESYKHPTKSLNDYFAVAWAKEPIEIRTVNGQQQFRVLITPQKNWKPGLYYVDVRAQRKGEKPVLISRRTILQLPH